MTILKEPTMGRFSVEVELSNHKDHFRAESGLIRPDQVSAALGAAESWIAALPGWSFRQLSLNNSAWNPPQPPTFATPMATQPSGPSSKMCI